MNPLLVLRLIQDHHRGFALIALSWWICTALTVTAVWWNWTLFSASSIWFHIRVFVVVMGLGTLLSTLLAWIGWMGRDRKS